MNKPRWALLLMMTLLGAVYAEAYVVVVVCGVLLMGVVA